MEKLKFNEVYFHGKVPIFKQYRTMWERSLEIEMNAVGLADLEEEVSIVDALLDYLKSCLASDVAESITMISDRYELAINKETQRVGILFPPWLVDMRLAPEMGDSFAPYSWRQGRT